MGAINSRERDGRDLGQSPQHVHEPIDLGWRVVEGLRRSVERVPGDPGYRERARARATEIANLDGVGRAADIVEEAFRTKRPVLAGR